MEREKTPADIMAELADVRRANVTAIKCVFCRRSVQTRRHHIVPECKGGRETVPTCQTCEDFIHKTWSHNQLRDEFNTVEKILADERFQKFLAWLRKQKVTTYFPSDRNRKRTKHPYR
jgi:5-methylcytosine-specific restriction enzyme A